MHVIKSSLSVGGFAIAVLSVPAQDRKPGLYEVTLTTTAVAPTPQVHPSRTWQACLTRQMIDQYGAIVPENLTRICQLANVVKKPGGMTANLVCSSKFMAGNGTLEVNWSDSEHSKGTIHFSGTIHPGDRDVKIEWNAVTSSVYKGPDCGTLKPSTTP